MTAYEMRISDLSSDVCSSDLREPALGVADVALQEPRETHALIFPAQVVQRERHLAELAVTDFVQHHHAPPVGVRLPLVFLVVQVGRAGHDAVADRSEEHTSELQSLMRISYAGFCLKKKNKQ